MTVTPNQYDSYSMTAGAPTSEAQASALYSECRADKTLETQALIEYEASFLDETDSADESKSSFQGIDMEVFDKTDTEIAVKPVEQMPMRSVFWLYLMLIGQLGESAIGMAYLSILLPKEIEQIVGTYSKGRILGALAASGSIFAIFGPPIIGYFSDRCKSVYGRRKPYLAAGLTIQTLGFVICGMTVYTGMAAIAINFLLITIGGVLFMTAFNALIPDCGDEKHIGILSGVMGALSIAGYGVGAGLAATVDAIGMRNVYFILAVVVMMTGMFSLYCFEDPQHVPPPEETDVDGEVVVATKSNIFVRVYEQVVQAFSPFEDHDFLWVFITRLLVQFGVFTVQEYLLYWVTDVLVISAIPSGATRTSLLIIPTMTGAGLSSVVVGAVSDKMNGRRKVFLIWSALLMSAVTFTVAWLMNYWVVLGLMLFFGVGMGCFLGMDYAVVFDVLPNKENVARDMGMWHISLVLPQLVAAPLAGVLLDAFNHVDGWRPYLGYTIIFIVTSLYLLIAGLLFTKLRNVK